MPLLTFGQSETSLKDTLSITENTADGREFTIDLVDDQKLGIMFRTTAVGMDIIREIHAGKKKAIAERDSVKAINIELKADIVDCDAERNEMAAHIIDLEIQNSTVITQRDDQVKLNKDAKVTIDKLTGQVKIAGILGPVGLGIGVAGVIGGVLYGILK